MDYSLLMVADFDLKMSGHAYGWKNGRCLPRGGAPVSRGECIGSMGSPLLLPTRPRMHKTPAAHAIEYGGMKWPSIVAQLCAGDQLEALVSSPLRRCLVGERFSFWEPWAVGEARLSEVEGFLEKWTLSGPRSEERSSAPEVTCLARMALAVSANTMKADTLLPAVRIMRSRWKPGLCLRRIDGVYVWGGLTVRGWGE